MAGTIQSPAWLVPSKTDEAEATLLLDPCPLEITVLAVLREPYFSVQVTFFRLIPNPFRVGEEVLLSRPLMLDEKERIAKAQDSKDKKPQAFLRGKSSFVKQLLRKNGGLADKKAGLAAPGKPKGVTAEVKAGVAEAKKNFPWLFK